MNKNTTIIERRKELIEVSKMAKAMRAAEEIDGTINYVLLNYIYKLKTLTSSKHSRSGKRKGLVCVKGRKRSWRGESRERKKQIVETCGKIFTRSLICFRIYRFTREKEK